MVTNSGMILCVTLQGRHEFIGSGECGRYKVVVERARQTRALVLVGFQDTLLELRKSDATTLISVDKIKGLVCLQIVEAWPHHLTTEDTELINCEYAVAIVVNPVKNLVGIIHEGVARVFAIVQKMVGMRPIHLRNVFNHDKALTFRILLLLFNFNAVYSCWSNVVKKALKQSFTRTLVPDVVQEGVKCLLIQHIFSEKRELRLEIFQGRNCISTEVRFFHNMIYGF
mmetsp:Transcript_16788/g.26195  ORF Transcript_16788/g.26195 Transcript_16788/m.26195 type:complete len:227 (-) Transcript_16788:109-789(-)